MTEYIIKQGKGIIQKIEDNETDIEKNQEYHPKEVLSIVMRRAWTTPNLIRIRRQLKDTGVSIVRPAYKNAAERIDLSSEYKKTAKDIHLEQRYEEIWK